jgi:hypothetical protein
MKSSIIPVTCGTALAAMCAAGLSHWWSVHQIVAMMDAGPADAASPGPVATTPGAVEKPAPQPAPVAAAPPIAAPPAAAPSPDQQQFFEALVSRIESLQNQNRDLIDQLAETNRDLMKLEFRVDTHSASFRPLPVNEEQPFTSLDTDIGVLPPRAEPVPSQD